MIRVRIDVRQIQAYIFESNRLAQMRGASRLLTAFDSATVRLALGIEEAEVIVGGGGHLEFEIPDGAADPFVRDVRQLFDRVTGLDRHRLVVGMGADRDGADAHIRAVKGAVAPPTLEHGLVRPCPVCKMRPVSLEVRLGPDEVQRVCTVCALRQEAAPGAVEDLRDRMQLEGRSTSASLADFAAASRPAGYLALVVADGDRIGQRFREAPPYLDRRELSEQIRAATTAAVQDAAAIVRSTDETSPTGCSGDERNDAHSPMLPLWVGGDDATVIFPAHSAFDAVRVLVSSFSRNMAPFAEKHVLEPFTMSAGLVIGKASHPMYDLANLALDLQKRAKRRMRDIEQKRQAEEPDHPYAGAVDFEIVKAPVAGDLQRRRAHSQLRPLLVQRATDGDISDDPLTLERWLDDVRRLLALEAPRSRIRSLTDQEPDRMADLIKNTSDGEVRRLLDEATTEARLDTLREMYEVVRV